MQRPERIAALLLALPGVVAPFLPFAFNDSPLDTIAPGWIWGRDLALLGAPFFLAIPIAIWQARRFLAVRASSFELAAAYALSAGAMASVLAFTATFLVRIGVEPLERLPMLLVFGSCWALAGANVLALLRNLAKGVDRETAVEVFLLGAYLPNAAFCLLGFGWDSIGKLQIGALFVVIAGIGYVVTIVLALRAERHLPAEVQSR